MGWKTGAIFPAGVEILLIITASRPTLRPTHLFPMDTRASFPGVKRLRREADHSLASGSEIKNAWIYRACEPFGDLKNFLSVGPS
jgi:hypothetical protein